MLETQTRTLEDLRVEIPTVVHDDDHTRATTQRRRGALEHASHAFRVLRDRALRRTASQLERSAVFEVEQLVRVAVLLVVVDQARDTAAT